MNLLFSATKRGNSITDTVRINSKTISIGNEVCDRWGIEGGDRAGIGFDDDGNLCLYHSKQDTPGLYKLSQNKNMGSALYISVQGSNTKLIEPYLGEYRVVRRVDYGKYCAINIKKIKK